MLMVGAAALVLLVLLAACAGIFLHHVLSVAAPARMRPPPVGEVTGSGVLTRSVFLQVPKVGTVTDIRMGGLDPSPAVKGGIAGSEGAALVDQKGAVTSSVAFGGILEHVDIVDVERDGTCEFMNRGSWGEPATLLDHRG